VTALAHHDEASASAVDRLGELASIGAGHAASALATLLARPFEMRVPRVRVLAPGHFDAAFASKLGGDLREWSGALFDVEGGPGGVLAVLFPPPSRDVLLADLLGENAGVEPQAESALREVGNIVASHALSAVGDLLGESVLPSVPRLELAGAPRELARLVGERAGEERALRIEVELSDRAGGVRGLLVWVPSVIS
jgi:chemotaxis protein CheC